MAQGLAVQVADVAKSGAAVAHADDFLELDRLPAIRAHVDGVPLFECQYGTHKGKYALRIERNLRGPDLTWLGDSYVN